MTTKEAYKPIEAILKEKGFKKHGSCWYKHISEYERWVICFQKNKAATKIVFELALNIGVYIEGTNNLIFNNETTFVCEADCFFNKRAKYFGSNTDWWKFDLENDNSETIKDINNVVENKIISFLEEKGTFSTLVDLLPIKDWEKNYSFHPDLLRVACGYLILGDKEKARELVKIVSSKEGGWAERAESVLKKI